MTNKTPGRKKKKNQTATAIIEGGPRRSNISSQQLSDKKTSREPGRLRSEGSG